MNRFELPKAIRILWTVTATGLIGVLMTGPDSGVRLWLLTVLAWLAAPSSFLVTPAANWLVIHLDLESLRAIDLLVGTTMALFGYVQWFVLPVIYKRRRRQVAPLSVPSAGRSKNASTEEHDRSTDDDAAVVVFYGDDSECLSLKMLLEGSGIAASLRNFSMSGGGFGRTDVRVFVESKDLDRARPLVEDSTSTCATRPNGNLC